MRLRLGRPEISRYREAFAVPGATAESAPTVTWLGVSTLLIDDGDCALLTDGYFSRPGLARIGLGTVAPSPPRVQGCLTRAGITGLTAVIPVHTHIDHALDSALVAHRTGALLVGGESAANLGRGHGLPEDLSLIHI